MRPPRRPSARTRARRPVLRLGALLASTTAGGVLLAGAPVLASPALVATSNATSADTSVARTSVAVTTRTGSRWPGHPGRTLVRHWVRPGETATGLAVRFHAWTRELQALNHLDGAGRLVAGRTVTIPVVDAAVPRKHARKTREHRSAHRSHQRATPRATHSSHRARAHRHPWRQAGASRARVRRLIVSTARRHGVNPHLALAISWQESGWQQRRTSSTGAIGAMQIMPDTGRWMALYVGRPLNIYALRDNVIAGVVLIKVLRGQVSRRHTIAAYYQGLGAVQEHGLYRDTVAYARNVTALYRRIHHGWRPA